MKNEFVATTLKGLEDVLEEEIKELGGENVRKLRRGIEFTGGLSLIYKLNFTVRTALRILYRIGSYMLRSEADLYKSTKKIAWENYVFPGRTIAVKAIVNSPLFNNSHFVALRVKDAIVDRLREKTGKRPDVDIKNPDVPVHIHLDGSRLTVSLDSSGDPLFKRGYRLKPYEAPLNEVLAAGMIMMSGWKGDSDFIDPMCGSATLAIEAAMIAMGIPPGVFRKSYAFQNWPDYDEELYRKVTEKMMVSREFKHKIYASDISVRAVNAARQNINAALLDDVINISIADFFQVSPASGKGILIMNPPYGERIKQERINSFYQRIGDHLKAEFAGYNAWLLSSNFGAIKKVGLRPTEKIPLLNGDLECRYLRYELFRGKRADFLK